MNIQFINFLTLLRGIFGFLGILDQSLPSLQCQMEGISYGMPLFNVINVSASYDNLRLYDLTSEPRHGIPPFWIIPGHQSGTIASVCTFIFFAPVNVDVDPSCRFMLTAGGNRGWGGTTTEVVMGYDVGIIP